MQVALVAFAFPPAALPEAYLSAKSMGALPGAAVDVVTLENDRSWIPSDPGFASYVDSRFRRVHRVRLPWAWRKLPARPLPWLTRSPDIFRFAAPTAASVALQLRPDVLVTWSQWHSAHLAGLHAKRERGRLPWVAHFSDPWVDNPYERYSPMLRRINARLEAKVVERADALIFTNDIARELVMAKYGAAASEKTHVVPHPFDPDLYGEPAMRSGPLRIRYLGGFYGARTPRPLFEALARMLSRSGSALDDVRFELIGGLAKAELASSLFQRLPPGLVVVRSPVPYLDSLRMMSEADLLLVIDAPASRSMFLPSKLVDYLGARRPIVGITPPGACAEVLAGAGGPVADPADIDAVVDALERGIALARAHRDRAWDGGGVRETFIVDTVRERTAAVLRGALESSS